MKKEFTIEVKGKDWEEALDKAFQKAVKNVKIDGFPKTESTQHRIYTIPHRFYPTLYGYPYRSH